MKRKIEIFLLVVLFFPACNQSNKTVTKKTQVHYGVTTQIMESNNYTFINLKGNNSESFWVAIPRINQKPQIGEIYFFTEGEKKIAYRVDDINMTFDTIYFTNKISADPSEFGITSVDDIKISQKAIQPSIEKQEVKIDQQENTITIANLFSGKDKFAGKTITVKGIVTKYNQGIMDRNWIHIQDGTKYAGNFDLTITSSDETSVGDTITATGQITIDKDFGFGYFYPVLMENTRIN